jgi:hypothetical protein
MVIGEWIQGWRLCSVKKINVARLKEVKIGWQIYQNNLWKAVAQKGLLCQ